MFKQKKMFKNGIIGLCLDVLGYFKMFKIGATYTFYVYLGMFHEGDGGTTGKTFYIGVC